MLERVMYTHKGEWFQNPSFGFDFNLLYKEPSPRDIEQEVRRALYELPAVAEVVSVSSVLAPPHRSQKESQLLITVHLIFEDEKELSQVFAF